MQRSPPLPPTAELIFLKTATLPLPHCAESCYADVEILKQLLLQLDPKMVGPAIVWFDKTQPYQCWPICLFNEIIVTIMYYVETRKQNWKTEKRIEKQKTIGEKEPSSYDSSWQGIERKSFQNLVIFW